MSKKHPTLSDVRNSFRQCVPLFHALGDTHRQEIVLILAESERLNVNMIVERMNLSRPAVSHHLKILLQAGLVQMQPQSRENFYSLTVDAGLAAIRLLVEQAEVVCAESS